MNKLLKLIRHGEGYEPRPYADTKGNMTWGIGRCYEKYPLTLNERFKVTSVCPMNADPNKPWTMDQTTFILSNIPKDKCEVVAEYFVQDVLNEIIPRIEKHFKWWSTCDEVRQAVWVDWIYNMGFGEVSSWNKSSQMMLEKKYQLLANEAYKYKWADDVGKYAPSKNNTAGGRAWYICKMLSTGEWPEWIT